jgi:hypothetical protein
MLRKLLSPSLVNQLLREFGAIFRVQRIAPYAFLWSIILGSGAGATRGTAALRRVSKRVTGPRIE